MNAIAHCVAQTIGARLLPAREDVTLEKADRAVWPSIISHGRKIDELHRGGMKLVDVANQLGMNYNGLRAIYSRYRKELAAGRITP